MIIKAVIFTCLTISVRSTPISVHEGVHYATAPAYSYTSSPLHTYAVPKLAPIVSAPLIAPVYHAPVYKQVEAEPFDPNPEYSYGYGVNDPDTGDNKQVEETLKDGIVRGSYSLSEPDGTIRKVTYTADKLNGFNAVVEKHGTPKYAEPLKYIAKYVAPSPIYHTPVAKYVAPRVVYQAPVAKYIAAAPVAKYVAPAAYHAPIYTSYHGYH